MEEKTILPCRRPFQSREKVEVLEWITNRGKDSVWVLRLLSTCSKNAQNLPRFSKIHLSNGKSGWIWHMGTEGISHLGDEFLKFIPFFWNSLKKKWKIGLKIGFGTLGSIPLEGRILRIYPAFLEFTKNINFF